MSKFKLIALTEPVNSKIGLEHAVMQSLLNWAKSQPNDPLEIGQKKNGWWASGFIAGVGCRDWTLARSKQTTETANRAKTYTTQALKWLITERIAKQVDVTTYFENDRLIRLVKITLPNNSIQEITL